MNFIKKFLQLKKINIFIIMGLLATLSCSGPQVITSGAGAAIAAAEDEKTLGDVFDDTSISIGIKDRVFMYEAILVTKIDVDVEKGKVLLTGILNDQSQRVEVVRLAWKQPGVKEVINEIEIEDSFNITSLTDTGTGAQTHNINNDMANDDYAPQLTQIASTDFQAVAINNIATGSFRGNMFDASALRDEKQSVVVFGELA